MPMLAKPKVAESICHAVAAGIFDTTGLGLSAALIKFGFAFANGPTYAQRLKALQRNVEKALPDDADYEQAEVDAARAIVRHELLHARELYDLGERPDRITDVLLRRRAAQLDGFGEQALGRVRTMVRAFVTAYLALPEVRADVERAARQSLRDLHRDLRAQLDAAERAGRDVQAMHDLLARWVQTDVLYDPRTSLRRWRDQDRAPQPSVALSSMYEVVPFQGRRAELQKIDAFRHKGDDFAVMLVEGEGGLGKTRLLMEAMRRALADGWRAGFLRSDLDAETVRRGLAALSASDKRLFVVIDYAEDRPEQVATVIAEWQDAGHRTRRVVLLTRHRALVKQTVRSQGFADPRLQRAAHYLDADLWDELGTQPMRVPPAERRAVFENAQAAFALLPGVDHEAVVPADALPDSFFDRSHFERPLYLHMAALASCSGPPTARKTGLLRAALDREESYLTRVLDDVPELSGRRIQGHELRPVLALATLAMAARPPGGTPPTAAALLDATSLGELPQRERNALATLLPTLYPLPEGTEAPGAMDALRPDVLGEGLVHSTLQTVPALATYALASERDTPSLASAATVLVRAALALEDDDPEAWLKVQLPVLSKLQKRPRLVRAFNDTIHQDTSRLRTLAAGLAYWLVPHAQRTLDNNPDDIGAQRSLAHALNWQGIRFSQQGAHEKALACSKKASAIYHNLVKRDPEAFEPELAASLINLGGDYSALGQHLNALLTTDEAVAICRRLAKRHPEAFEPELATSLSNLGNDYYNLSQFEKALAATDEAVALNRRLVERNPEAFEPKLAMSLNNLGRDCSSLGLHKKALAAAEEAVVLYRLLAQRSPDIFELDLAMSLNNLGMWFSNIGRNGEALGATDEAIALYRSLAERNPEAFEPKLAASLGARGIALGIAERPDEAAASFAKGLSTITPHMLRSPAAYLQLGMGLEQLYIQACQAAGQEPDETLLAPSAALMKKARAAQAPPTSAPD